MPQIISVGPFTLDGHLLVYILAIIAGYLIIMLRLRDRGDDAKPILEIIISCVLCVILFWKFGTLLFKPSIIWNKPWQILMITGTWKQVALGVGVAFIYAIYKLRKLERSLLLFMDVLPYGITTAAICKSLLIWEYGAQTNLPWGISLSDPLFHYHPLNVYLLLLSAVLLFCFWWRKDILGKGKVIQDFLMYYGIGLWVISLFENTAGGRVLFSGAQLVYLSMIVLGLAIPYIIRRRTKGVGVVKNTQSQDSKEQLEQKKENDKLEKENNTRSTAPSDNKKLDGPNRPST